MRNLFRQLADQQGMTILMSSHLLSEIQQIADRVGVIADGRIVLEEEAEIIRKNHPQDMEDYLLAAIEGGIHLDESSLALIETTPPALLSFGDHFEWCVFAWISIFYGCYPVH